jgi:hypothetical protein
MNYEFPHHFFNKILKVVPFPTSLCFTNISPLVILFNDSFTQRQAKSPTTLFLW